MKHRRQFLWLGLAVVLVIALAIFFGKKSNEGASLPAPTAVQDDGIANGPVTNHSIRSQRPTNQAVSASAVATVNQPTSPTQDTEHEKREELATLNDEDIFLNGKVIDQFGNPVSGAAVSASIGVNNGTRVGMDKIFMTTDADGTFTISGHKGKDMGITIQKAGYELATTNNYFVYSLLWPKSRQFTPDQNNPVVFKMWKLQGAEPLVTINQKYRLPNTATPICFDLVAGNIVPSGGDLKITIIRPNGVISEQNPQSWSVDVEVNNGGFIVTSDNEWGVTYAAPDGGYQPSGIFTNNNGPEITQEALFVQSRGGQVYSKVGLWLRINQTENGFMNLTLNGVANANGSRNWEAAASQ